MATSRMLLLQKAVRSITSQDNFRRRWASCTSIQKAVFVRYILKGVQINKRNTSTAFSRLSPNLSNLATSNEAGIYAGVMSKERYFWVQDPKDKPPIFPNTTINSEQWDIIKKRDIDELEKYLSRLERSRSMQRSTKRQRFDSIDIQDNINIANENK